MKPKSARADGYSVLFNDKNLKRWYDNVSRGSQVTADVYLRRLGHLCNDLEKTPQELARMKEDQLYELLLDMVSGMEKEGRSGSYILSQLKAVKSWLLHNRIAVTGRIRIKGVQDTPTLQDERVPTKPELKRIFVAGDEKSRVACAFIAHAGVRPETLGHYRGNEGLRMRDLPDLSIEDKKIEFPKVPAMVIVRRELSKGGHQYFTFLTEEACGYLKDYLDLRIRQNEALGPDSAVITPKQRTKPFIRTSNIGDAIRNSIRKAGFLWRPYVLRSYFDTQLMLAESKGLVLRDYRQFWMGHKGDIESRYTTNKHRLPESVIEDMREAFRKSQEFLQTTETGESARDTEGLRRRQILDTAKLLGFSEDKIKKIEDALAKYEQVDEAFDEIRKLGLQTSRDNHQLSGDRKQQTRIIKGESALVQLLDQHWDLVRELKDDRYILRRELD
jgi:hypothetical protein